ncbi:MAG: hypothetical protein GZ093_12135 [Rhodoferax sp.]|uniref:ThiF family adenylyltransferase n=1 Tax=Rhodoferax sp. TaxID=50421 RepID=UPI0013FFDAE2|nr:ThiF family adenylyltransferase [Rhodoferax sp.]NDP39481.1 hypothetical protein [Rhodoferax sp.]
MLRASAIRCPVSRVDGAWIHGRDQNEQYQSLAQRKIAFIGCGALGAAIARLLAQVGLGACILVDGDDLAGHNTSRHVLGQRFTGKNKAVATAKMLKEDFPHIKSADAFPHRFQALCTADLQKLAECDVVISAGIDIDGDAALDHWRTGLAKPPVHVCAWVEPFAVEAGCGNVFQPHGAVELQATVGLAAGVALDVFTGRVSKSMRRVWQGDADDASRRGGIVLPSFTENKSVTEHPWL